MHGRRWPRRSGGSHGPSLRNLFFLVLEGSIFCRRFLDREFRDSALGLVRRRDAELDWSIFGGGIRRRNRGTLLITLGQFPVFRSFFRILRFRVDALQSAAAERSFGEAGRPRVQRGPPPSDAQIVGRRRSCAAT